jgi:hypothetical protein
MMFCSSFESFRYVINISRKIHWISTLALEPNSINVHQAEWTNLRIKFHEVELEASILLLHCCVVVLCYYASFTLLLHHNLRMINKNLQMLTYMQLLYRHQIGVCFCCNWECHGSILFVHLWIKWCCYYPRCFPSFDFPYLLENEKRHAIFRASSPQLYSRVKLSDFF